MRWRAYNKVTGKMWKPQKGYHDKVLMVSSGRLIRIYSPDGYAFSEEALKGYEARFDDKVVIPVRNKKGFVSAVLRSNFNAEMHDKLFYLEVKILSATVKDIWYADKIGEVLTVVSAATLKGYYTLLDAKLNKVVRKSDCKVVVSDCHLHARA